MSKIIKCKRCGGEAMSVPKRLPDGSLVPMWGWCKGCWKLKAEAGVYWK
jgi:hypothetical protein